MSEPTENPDISSLPRDYRELIRDDSAELDDSQEPASLVRSPLLDVSSGRWLLACLCGIVVSMFMLSLARNLVFWQFPASCAALMLGLCAAALCAPWRDHQRVRATSHDIHELTQWLRLVSQGKRTQPLREILIDRDDEIGELSQAIFECLQETIANRIESKMLNKSMEDNIQRHT
ncbi:MAG TPA: hypothetical protein VG711_09970, partial [Phycisphaerales bacterium]|nr:hypothetical protein [Phycisphaerales bacterium]